MLPTEPPFRPCPKEVGDLPDPLLGPVDEVALLRDAQRRSLVARNARLDSSIQEEPSMHRSGMVRAGWGKNQYARGESGSAGWRQDQSVQKAARERMRKGYFRAVFEK